MVLTSKYATFDNQTWNVSFAKLLNRYKLLNERSQHTTEKYFFFRLQLTNREMKNYCRNLLFKLNEICFYLLQLKRTNSFLMFVSSNCSMGFNM